MRTSRLALTIALTIAGLAVVLAACSSGSPGALDAQPPATTSPDILNFSAPALDGPEVVGQDYSGQDVALWFWAPW